MKLGVNSFLWTAQFGPSFFSILPRVREYGFDAFEIPVFDPAQIDAPAIRRELDANGLECTMCAILPPGLSAIDSDAAVRAKTRDHLVRCVELAAQMGSKLLSGPVYAQAGYLAGRRRTPQEWDWAVECLRGVGPSLAANGVTLAIEALNRFETFFLNTAADTADFCDAIGDPRIGVLLDTFHANIEEKNIAESCRHLGSRLRHVHACENDRGIPGSGHVDFPGIVDALKEIGYGGYLTIESFGFNLPEMAASAAIWRDLAPSPEAIAAEGVVYLRKLLARPKTGSLLQYGD
jgi:D-psicose/D-tagatose/L-ribulose 3-epimerase